MRAFLAVLLVLACAAARGDLLVGIAPSAVPLAEPVAREFAAARGVKVELAQAASGLLARQAREGAPYDAVISADRRRIDELARDGIVDPATAAVYFVGSLDLWVSGAMPECRGPADLALPGFARATIAIANPEAAPYGAAAREVLQRAGVWDGLGKRLVQGDNVAQALQIAMSGNCDAAFLPGTFELPAPWRRVPVDPALHAPIEQALGVVAASTNRALAAEFCSAVVAACAAKGARPQPAAAAREPVLVPLWLTLRIAAASTAIAMVLGSLLGWVLARAQFPGKRLFSAAVLLPLILPPTVLGYYLLVAIGRRGPVGRAWEAVFGGPMVFTVWAAILAACAATIPIVARQLAAAFEGIGEDVAEAARLDGASGLKLLLHIHLPLIRPAAFAAATIAFARAVGDFGTTLMVAGSIPGETRTASLAIYDLMNAGRDGEAMVLVLAVTVLSVAVLAFTSGRER